MGKAGRLATGHTASAFRGASQNRMNQKEPYRKNGTLFQAGQNSWDGLAVLVRERAARRELWVIAATIILHIAWPTPYTLLLVLLALILLAVEALNTAIETICDHVTPERHPMIKRAKDLGSAAIFIVCLALGMVLLRVLWEAVHLLWL